jgi:hypothetical protein
LDLAGSSTVAHHIQSSVKDWLDQSGNFEHLLSILILICLVWVIEIQSVFAKNEVAVCTGSDYPTATTQTALCNEAGTIYNIDPIKSGLKAFNLSKSDGTSANILSQNTNGIAILIVQVRISRL